MSEKVNLPVKTAFYQMKRVGYKSGHFREFSKPVCLRGLFSLVILEKDRAHRFDFEKVSIESDQHHVPVQRSRTISCLSVVT